jgi:hypothetical protein
MRGELHCPTVLVTAPSLVDDPPQATPSKPSDASSAKRSAEAEPPSRRDAMCSAVAAAVPGKVVPTCHRAPRVGNVSSSRRGAVSHAYRLRQRSPLSGAVCGVCKLWILLWNPSRPARRQEALRSRSLWAGWKALPGGGASGWSALPGGARFRVEGASGWSALPGGARFRVERASGWSALPGGGPFRVEGLPQGARSRTQSASGWRAPPDAGASGRRGFWTPGFCTPGFWTPGFWTLPGTG